MARNNRPEMHEDNSSSKLSILVSVESDDAKRLERIANERGWPAGSRPQGAIGALTAGFRLSRHQGNALHEPQLRLCDAVRSSSSLCMDETGWKQAGERRFLWGAFTEEAAVLRVAAS